MPFEVLNNQIKINRDEILAELYQSQQHHTAVGIFIKETHELITTAVTNIELNETKSEYVICLHDQDLHGFPLETTRLLLSDIDKIIRFNVQFDDPQYVKVRRKEKFKT